MQSARGTWRHLGLQMVVGLALSAAVGPLVAAPTTADQARSAVTGWLKADGAPLGAGMGRQVAEVDSYARQDGQVLYHVVTVGSGFVVVSADDLVEPIVAFCEAGTFDSDPSKPLGALVGSDLGGRMAAARESTSARVGLPKPTAIQSKWAELIRQAESSIETGLTSVSDLRVAPLLLSRWNQNDECGTDCYDYYTPNHYPTGCVATALAQILRFHQWPATPIGRLPFTIYVNGGALTAYTRGGDGLGGAYNWSQMPLDPDCTLTPAQRQAIGALCFDAGVTVNMDYTDDGSGADSFEAKDALLNVFGYSNARRGYNNGGNIGAGLQGMLNPNLDAGFPVIIGVSGPSGGHAVIPDGYGYNSGALYHHLNMGWGGEDDAWYNLPAIDAYYNFNAVESCIYNIYATQSGEIISGRVLDLGGNPIAGAIVTGQTATGSKTATSNSRGIYALARIPSSSTYAITVTKAGYTFTSQNVTTGTSSDWSATSGNRWPIDFVAGPHPPEAQSSSATTDASTPVTITLQAFDDGQPNPPGAMTFTIRSLPAHGSLAVSGGPTINSVPYAIAGGGRQVVYLAAAGYSGADAFTFSASDGGSLPSGGESAAATVSITVSVCSTTGIGIGTATWDFPLHTYYEDCRTQTIYLASEIGRAGNISALALDVTTIPQQVMNDFTIRMKHTSLSVYSPASLEATGWTTVYQANEPQGTTGWRTFTFTTPFTYDGTSNLMVDISVDNATYTASGRCRVSTPGGTRSAHKARDSDQGDPLDWSGETYVTDSTNVPNLRLTFCASEGPPPAPAATCNLETVCPGYSTMIGASFASIPDFGPEGIDHYHYIWDKNPATEPTAATADTWSSETLELNFTSTGNWYLHLLSHSPGHFSGGVVHYGPYLAASVPSFLYPAGDYDWNCRVDADDFPMFAACAKGPDIPTGLECFDFRLDGDNDVDQDDFAIFQRCWSGELPADPRCGH